MMARLLFFWSFEHADVGNSILEIGFALADKAETDIERFQVCLGAYQDRLLGPTPCYVVDAALHQIRELMNNR